MTTTPLAPNDLAQQLLVAVLDESDGSAGSIADLLCEVASSQAALDEVVIACDKDPWTRKALWDTLDMHLFLDGDVEGVPVEINESEVIAQARAKIAAIRTWVNCAQDRVPRELYDWCDLAFVQLNAPRSLKGNERPPAYRLSLSLSAPSSALEPLWISVKAEYLDGTPSTLWASRRDVGVSSTWLSIALLELAEDVDFAAIPPPSWSSPPLYRYHPERFKATRGYSKRVKGIHSYLGLPRENACNAMTHLVQNEMALRAAEFDSRIAMEDAGRFKMWIRDIEVPLAFTWANFVNAGRQIFELKPDLVELLRHTGPGDIGMSEIRLPYQVFYVRFGAQADWQLAPGWMIEGCYVEHHVQQQLLIFRFTCRPDQPDRAIEWAVRREPQISISMKDAVLLLDIETAIDTALAEHLGMIGAARIEVLANTARPELSRERALDRLNAEEDEIRAMLPIAHAAMHLVASALCFLTAYEDDISPVWPAETPKALLSTLTTGTAKQRAKAHSQLEQMGYTQVRLCGARIRGQAAGVSSDASAGVRTHWRRGHWRRQAHGEGRSLRKLIWLMPTLVNAAGSADPSVPGHVYLAE